MGRPTLPIRWIGSGSIGPFFDLWPAHMANRPCAYGSGQLPNGSTRPTPILTNYLYFIKAMSGITMPGVHETWWSGTFSHELLLSLNPFLLICVVLNFLLLVQWTKLEGCTMHIKMYKGKLNVFAMVRCGIWVGNRNARWHSDGWITVKCLKDGVIEIGNGKCIKDGVSNRNLQSAGRMR